MSITPLKLSLFVIFHVIMPCGDVATDFSTFLSFLQHDHQYWAAITLAWMFLPFLANILILCRHFALSRRMGQLKMILLHFPFILPLRNLYNAYRLRYAAGPFFPREVEEIYQEAGSLGMFESFLEAGPQMITQLVIILSTGGVSSAQLASLPISFISLSYTASKAFFMLRDRETRETDPNIRMVVLIVLPWMMMAVLSSIVIWTFLGGLVGEYVLVGIVLNIVTVLFSLKWRKYLTRADEELFEDDMQESESSFHIESTLTSVWVPSIVGGKTYIFWTSAVSSIVAKTIIIVTVCLLDSTSEFLTWLRNGKVFLFWCVKDAIYTCADKHCVYNTCSDFTREVFNLTHCFSLEKEDMLQKIRVCNQNELEIRVVIFLCLILSIVMSLLASYKLAKVSQWWELTRPSRFLCLPVKPVYHRSLLFSFIRNNDHQGLDNFLENIVDDTARRDLVNVYNADGRKAMMVAKDRQLLDVWAVLAKHGGVHSDHGQSDQIVRLLAVLGKVGDTVRQVDLTDWRN